MAFLVLGLKNAAQFAVYEPTKRWQINRNGGGALTPGQAFVHGAFSRLVSDTVLFPARRAKVLQQQALKDDKGDSKASMVRARFPQAPAPQRHLTLVVVACPAGRAEPCRPREGRPVRV